MNFEAECLRMRKKNTPHCFWCDAEVTAKPYLKNVKRRWCSRECYSTWYREAVVIPKKEAAKAAKAKQEG